MDPDQKSRKSRRPSESMILSESRKSRRSMESSLPFVSDPPPLQQQLPSDAFDAMRGNITDLPPAAHGGPQPELYGEEGQSQARFLMGKRKGAVVSKAGEFLKSISGHPKYFPIFKSKFSDKGGELNKAGKELLLKSEYHRIIKKVQSKSGTWSIDVKVNQPTDLPSGKITQPPPTLRTGITKYADTGNALVFLIAIKAPHALIVIRTPDGKNYSFGFGYSGRLRRGASPKLESVHRAFTNVQGILPQFISKKLPNDMAHVVEPLRGAIYTADYMTPNTTHEAKIIWVGILTPKIIANINAALATADELTIGGKYLDISSVYVCDHDHCRYQVVAPYKEGKEGSLCPWCSKGTLKRDSAQENIIPILEMKLNIKCIYLESAGFAFTNNGTYFNCLEWAKSILDIHYLNCGFLGNPFDCLEVTEDEGRVILDNLASEALPSIIGHIQQRLYEPGRIKQIANCVSVGCLKSGGGRRRKINKKYTKRRRIHSRRQRSISKKQIKQNK